MNAAPSPSSHASVGAAGPLSPEHLHELAAARERSKTVRRAAGVASLSGWTLAIFAGVTGMGALFGDASSLVMAILLGAMAYNELRGGKLLRQFDERGPRVLGYNQLALSAVLVAYAGWSLRAAAATSSLASVGGTTGDAQMDATIRGLESTVATFLYGGMAVVGVIGPGLTAWYYFSRGRVLREVKAATPGWVLETMRATA